jgi:hypothetical protein
MLTCPEEEEFDTKTSRCTFVCKKEGKFPVPGNPQKYRECIKVGTGFELNEGECPDGSEFDPDKGKCIVTRLLILRRWK